MRYLIAFMWAVALVVLALAPTVAFAQTSEVGLGGIFDILEPYLIELIVLLVGAVVSWVSVKLNKLTGLSIDAKHRDALQSALLNGAYAGIHAIEKRADRASIDVQSAILARGITYVQKSVPDAVKHFKLSPTDIRELLEAKLPGEENPKDD